MHCINRGRSLNQGRKLLIAATNKLLDLGLISRQPENDDPECTGGKLFTTLYNYPTLIIWMDMGDYNEINIKAFWQCAPAPGEKDLPVKIYTQRMWPFPDENASYSGGACGWLERRKGLYLKKQVVKWFSKEASERLKAMNCEAPNGFGLFK